MVQRKDRTTRGVIELPNTPTKELLIMYLDAEMFLDRRLYLAALELTTTLTTTVPLPLHGLFHVRPLLGLPHDAYEGSHDSLGRPFLRFEILPPDTHVSVLEARISWSRFRGRWDSHSVPRESETSGKYIGSVIDMRFLFLRSLLTCSSIALSIYHHKATKHNSLFVYSNALSLYVNI